MLPGCGKSSGGSAPAELQLYVAASTAHVIEPLMVEYQNRTGVVVRVNAAASSTLARQIEQGAPADVYLSANEKWMDHLAGKKLIDPASRRDLLGNRLVLVAPASHNTPAMSISDALSKLDGRLAMGDPDAVPAGLYGKAALQSMKLWAAVEPHVAAAKDVRSALLLVERGEADFGIVYATDAASSQRVTTVATFDENTHKPIRYPIALTTQAQAAVNPLFDYLLSSTSREAFEAAGFTFYANDGGDDAR
ncbi:molybdate ABC transporter substrate-binding protein [Planctomycetales bacterium ZRK34]|nr:molybdate ABC transporter substrate-binding protein [Planctomycetales bacterium ZRK34]